MQRKVFPLFVEMVEAARKREGKKTARDWPGGWGKLARLDKQDMFELMAGLPPDPKCDDSRAFALQCFKEKERENNRVAASRLKPCSRLTASGGRLCDEFTTAEVLGSRFGSACAGEGGCTDALDGGSGRDRPLGA